MWIGNDDGYVRRVQAGASERQARRTASVVVTLSDFGKPVSVTAAAGVARRADAAALMSSFKSNFFKRG